MVVDTPQPLLSLLACPEAPDLTAWYAEPLPTEAIPGWQYGLQRRLGDCYRRGTSPAPGLRLGGLILSAAASRDTEVSHATLHRDCPGPWAALAELIQGQLLLARHRRGAWEHLDLGLRLARPYWRGQDYFVVLDRHTRLRPLPLGDQPRPPLALCGLLAEAGVIARLRGLRPHQVSRGSHLDTID